MKEGKVFQQEDRQKNQVKRYLPWVVATALFMEQLDTTIVNTAVPAMARGLGVTPLSLKTVVASYILSLALFIPISGWMSDRFGTRKIFALAVFGFTISSLLCGMAVNLTMLVVTRLLQGMSAAMMVPVGRIAIISTFEKSELLSAMNFVIIPALIGPLLGPTVGGLIVHFFSWREIFLINVPIGCFALWVIWQKMPNYQKKHTPSFDVRGFFLFGSGMVLLSWLLEIFGEHKISWQIAGLWFVIAFGFLGAYVWHARSKSFPLLDLRLFSLRTFRVAVAGGFCTRFGVGGLPFLLPLLYQLGLGFPAWKSGLLMMPIAFAAMGMKAISAHLLRYFGYRLVLFANTFSIGITMCLYATVTAQTSLLSIVFLGLSQGFFSSLQFSGMNSMAYSDIKTEDVSQASTIASSMQQLSMSFGLAFGSLVAGFYLGGLSQTDQQAVIGALHKAFLTLGGLTLFSAFSFLTLKKRDGESVSRGKGGGALLS